MSILSSGPKRADTDHDILPLFSQRFSPYVFSRKPVSRDDIRALFEAARWAPSSYNEQPWSYIVATADQERDFQRLVSCLLEGNQHWAKRAPVLALGLYRSTFDKNGKDNPAAPHDLGIASAFLTVEATRRGLYVHQMIGIDANKVRDAYSLPENVVPYTGLAVGYRGDASDAAELPEGYPGRDEKQRSRKPQSEFLFCGDFAKAWEG